MKIRRCLFFLISLHQLRLGCLFRFTSPSTFYVNSKWRITNSDIRENLRPLQGSLSPDKNDDLPTVIRKSLAGFLASAATMQLFIGGSGASTYDDNFDKITSRLAEKLLKEKSVEEAASLLPIEAMQQDIPQKQDLYSNIENLVSTDISVLDDSVLQSDVNSLRDSIRYLATDWKAWVCAAAIVVTTDATISKKEYAKLNLRQKAQIDELYAKLKYIEQKGMEKEDTMRNMELLTQESVQELDALSSELEARTSELEALKMSLRELQEVDGQLLQMAKEEKHELLTNISRLTSETELQAEAYDRLITEKNTEFALLQSNLTSVEEREKELVDLVMAVLIGQRYVNESQALSMTPHTLKDALTHILSNEPPKDIQIRLTETESKNRILESNFTNAEKELDRMKVKLSYANGKLEESTVYQLQAMERISDFKTRIWQQEKDIKRLQGLLKDTKEQLKATDIACEEAVSATTEAVNRAISLEEDLARVTLRVEMMEQEKLEAIERAEKSAENITRIYNAELSVSSERVNTMIETEIALRKAELTVHKLRQDLTEAQSQLAAVEGVKTARVSAERLVEVQAQEILSLKRKLEEATITAIDNSRLNDTVQSLSSSLLDKSKQLIGLGTHTLSKEILERQVATLSSENKALQDILQQTSLSLNASEAQVTILTDRFEQLERSLLGNTSSRVESGENMDLESYLRELAIENEDLRQKLIVSEERLWEMQQESQVKLDNVKALARELTSKLGVEMTPIEEFQEGLSITDMDLTMTRKIPTSTSRMSPKMMRKVEEWRRLNSNALMKKTKTDIDKMLRGMGVKRRGGFLSMSKGELVTLLQEKLRATSDVV